MAVPRVFISSTCYDLKHIRESLKYFVKNIGYDPVLSDEGDVFYNPHSHTHDACLDEVSNCQIFVLIIGGRYGGIHANSTESITNEEYRIAVSNNIPVFTMVDASVSADHYLYQMNGKNTLIDRDKVTYPASDNVKIFHFINEVRKKSFNNAIFPFRNFLDIETYLKKQWAGMLFDFLLRAKNEGQTAITNKLLSDLSQASRKTEELVKFVYSKLDEANAETVINSVSEKVNAEKFVSLVLGMTGGSTLNSTDIERLLKIPVDKTWYEYLIESSDFEEDEQYDIEEDVVYRSLWSPSINNYRMVLSKTDDSNIMEDINNEDFEESFNSLKRLDRDTQKEILSKLL
ncbi:DUF4062 domain-containing protein [Photobacterium profundum]|uniref:DUF4062 domain-containing protein n=1 Tax=Photobacterium profundum (strain SS9) TaxID=298386 RepID=Q6LSK2_PHOPR|nr:DUF4062 domain-containing protein [Photobacterium profundum]CAG19724.1 conserved hypothetical protein [Photobacterium profundum SS9]